MANLFLTMAGWRETETYSAARRNQEAMACRSGFFICACL